MKPLTISGLARAGGVGVETVRYYQRRGLLPTPPRGSASGTMQIRHYEDADVRRLRFIRSAQASGFTLAQIKELISLDPNKNRKRARELAGTRIADLDRKIAAMTEARAHLVELAALCSSGLGPCPIIPNIDPSV